MKKVTLQDVAKVCEMRRKIVRTYEQYADLDGKFFDTYHIIPLIFQESNNKDFEKADVEEEENFEDIEEEDRDIYVLYTIVIDEVFRNIKELRDFLKNPEIIIKENEDLIYYIPVFRRIIDQYRREFDFILRVYEGTFKKLGIGDEPLIALVKYWLARFYREEYNRLNRLTKLSSIRPLPYHFYPVYFPSKSLFLLLYEVPGNLYNAIDMQHVNKIYLFRTLTGENHIPSHFKFSLDKTLEELIQDTRVCYPSILWGEVLTYPPIECYDYYPDPHSIKRRWTSKKCEMKGSLRGYLIMPYKVEANKDIKEFADEFYEKVFIPTLKRVYTAYRLLEEAFLVMIR